MYIQVLSKEALKDSVSLSRYYQPTDSMIVAVLHPTAKYVGR